MDLFKKNQPKLLKVEVSEKNVRLRVVLVVLLLAAGLSLLAYWFYSLITKEPGWYTVELTEGPVELNDEFIFNYRLEGDKRSAADEYKAVSTLYAAELGRVHRLLDVYRGYENIVNLYTLNQYPGEIFEVDPLLYQAFELTERMGSRIPYMAPVFSVYRHLFGSQNDVEAALCDPHTDEETRVYLEEVMAYATNPDMIRVELLGENRISLAVSEAYRAFARENGITDLVDFGWLTNAFIVDHVAEVMIERGFTAGNMTSYDGYTRNFDASGEYYGFNIFDRDEKNVYPAAVAQYQGYISMVFLRDYPLSEQDMAVFYAYADGRYVHRYADLTTGVSKSAMHNLVSYSYDGGCAEVAIRMADVFMADEVDEGKLKAMGRDQIYSVWSVDRTVRYNDGGLALRDLYENDGVTYRGEYCGIQ